MAKVTTVGDRTFTIPAAAFAAGFGKLPFKAFIDNLNESIDVHTKHQTQDEWTKAVAMFALRGLVETLAQNSSGFHWEDLSREYINSVYLVERRIINRMGPNETALASLLISAGRPKING